MLGEPKNQFSLTRAALSTCERAQSKFLSINQFSLTRAALSTRGAQKQILISDRELINSNDVLIGVPNPLEKSKECYIAWFMPGDLENLLAPWPGCEGLFPIANNGAGDQFLIDLRQPDPEVIYYLHETGERKEIGARLSAFLAAPRQPVPDE